ncbi:hypothetical protein [Saccharopolyspora erythraea]|uniref:hypothetical protein n=1 Tax=Saccharopolyspora erythraea TaxID=1836 RepID=UPI001E6598CC|nr:hypothetical protein [Saccharopolyspora erythraea]
MLVELRETRSGQVSADATVITRDGNDVRWWTWAGFRANASLSATLEDLTDQYTRFDDVSIRLRGDLTREMWQAGVADPETRSRLPEIEERALNGLKFNEALPQELATSTLAARLADIDGAIKALKQSVRFVAQG